jgi:RNA polymerase sigma-70 factor (ECF subfamily)
MPPADPIPEAAQTQDRDLALMRLVQSGDMEALREIIETHQQRVASMALRVGGPTVDIDDVAHQTFVRVWKFAHRYEPTARFTSWLLTITRNIVLNEIRYRSRHPTVSLDSQSDPDRPPDPGPVDLATRRPDQALLEAELQTAIDEALQKLPENQRTALVLRTYENLPYEEIAAILETSVGSVKSLLFRARTSMRDLMDSYLS